VDRALLIEGQRELDENGGVSEDGHRPEFTRRTQNIAGRMIGAVVGPLVSPVVDQVDVDHVLSRIDVDHVLARVDIDLVLERIDVDAVLDRIDLDRLIARIDMNQLIDRVDIDSLMGRVDIDSLMGRVDLDSVVARLDLNQVVARLDLNQVLARVDINALVEQTELGALIARSTSGVLSTVLDALRSWVVSLDMAVHGVIDRVLRRSRSGGDTDVDAGPDAAAGSTSPTVLPWRRDLALQGQAAGAVSRLLAFAFDWFLIGVLFAFGQRLFSLALEVVVGNTWTPSDHRIIEGIAFLVWAFLYFAVPIGVLGRTPGKGLLGLKIVRTDGTPVDGRHARRRTLALPLSFLVFGVGLLLGLFRSDRRTLHDLIADTTEVYAWDARGAHLRLLATHQAAA
jgi:uncharacterized RDD family membrane protein YckC